MKTSREINGNWFVSSKHIHTHTHVSHANGIFRRFYIFRSSFFAIVSRRIRLRSCVCVWSTSFGCATNIIIMQKSKSLRNRMRSRGYREYGNGIGSVRRTSNAIKKFNWLLSTHISSKWNMRTCVPFRHPFDVCEGLRSTLNEQSDVKNKNFSNLFETTTAYDIVDWVVGAHFQTPAIFVILLSWKMNGWKMKNEKKKLPAHNTHSYVYCYWLL